DVRRAVRALLEIGGAGFRIGQAFGKLLRTLPLPARDAHPGAAWLGPFIPLLADLVGRLVNLNRAFGHAHGCRHLPGTSCVVLGEFTRRDGSTRSEPRWLTCNGCY